MGRLLRMAVNGSSQPVLQLYYEIVGIGGANTGTCTIYRNGSLLFQSSANVAESLTFISPGDQIYATFSGVDSGLTFLVNGSTNAIYTGTSITTATTTAATGEFYKYYFQVGGIT